MAKEPPIHKDVLGQDLVEGCYVAMAYHNMMYVGKVTKLNPKMIRVLPVKGRYSEGMLTYSHNTVRIDGPDAMFYILQHQGTQ